VLLALVLALALALLVPGNQDSETASSKLLVR